MLPEQLKLTAVQERIWRAIADYMLAHDYSPVVRDIQAVTGSSTSVIHYTLERLDERGYIQLAPPNDNGNRPARSYQLLVWPMDCAEVPKKHIPVRRATQVKRQPPARRKAKRKPAARKKPKPRQPKERPSWWYQTVDHALAKELDVKPRTLRVILSLGAKTVHEAAMLLETRPAQVRNMGIKRDLEQALAKFERLKEAS